MSTSILDVVADKRVVLCAGPGGVGKTTTSAAIALAAAAAGRRVLVLTIDPARRLADALGVGLDNQPRRIPNQTFEQQGLEVQGELWALMLDATETFHDVVRSLAPTPQAAERILRNPIYRQISRNMPGTLEYTAVDKLYALYTEIDVDLIVVDTPPSQNVLDFLEAPEWLTRFLDERILKWFLYLQGETGGSRFGAGLLRKTGRLVTDLLGRVLGDAFVDEVVDFLAAIYSMSQALRERAEATQALLTSPESLFLVVSTADGHVLRDAVFLQRTIFQRGISFGGFVINRTHPISGVEDMEQALGAVQGAVGDDPLWDGLAAKAQELCRSMDAQAAAERAAVERLCADTSWRGFLALLPRQVEGVADLSSLSALSRHLVTSS